MKRKIILSFLAVFLLISLGAGFATMYAGNVTSTLSRLIKLHQIEGSRHLLIMSIHTVQSDLYTVHTDAGRKLDSIVDNVTLLEQSAQKCSSCHHTPEIARRIEEIQSLIVDYQNSLSFYITASANDEQISKLKLEAAGIGNELLGKTEDLSIHASSKLNILTAKVLSEVKRASMIFMSTMLFAIILSIIVAARLTKAITRPIDALVKATRTISAGDLDHLIEYNDRTEFGELASHFNAMITSLKSGYAKLEEEVSERKCTEEALRESEERYAVAALGSNDGLWDWDLRNDKIYFSSRWKSMLGYADDEIGTSAEEWFQRVHPDDVSEVKTKIAAHISGVDQHYEGEFRIMHRDGVYRWVLSRGLAIWDAYGRACRMAGSQTDITLRKATMEQLVYNAFHDSLTGLPNRALFMDRLQHVIDNQKRRGNRMFYAVLFIDINRFKIVNDSLGHLIGDKLLIAMGNKLTECVRPGDTVARLGGDEFSVLLENSSKLQDVYDVSSRIHKALSTPFLIEEQEVYASVSIGIAPGPENYDRAEQVLRDADIAMYQAKGQQDVSTETFDARMHASILDRIMLESDLRAALDHDQFVLFYQPIIDLKTHALSGFEALIRWNHPERGLVSPAEFIPVAEETGLITKIGEWVILEACRELKSLQTRYPSQPPLKMSINISGRQFAHENLADVVADAIRETEVIPQSVAIEVTESMLLENVEMVITTMNRIRAMGVHIHIDDFGTGYSSLSYLHRLPINALKIDRSFISKLTSNGENQEIVRSVISLAKSLNLDVIAEGVELDHQLLQIKELECHFGQGYLFSKPMKAALIDEWLTANDLTAVDSAVSTISHSADCTTAAGSAHERLPA